MGVEGKSYKKTEDDPKYSHKIIHDPKLPMDQALKPYSTYFGGGYPGIIKEEYFIGAEFTEESVKAAKLLEPDAYKEGWARFTYTAEGQQKLDSLADEIESMLTRRQTGSFLGTCDYRTGMNMSKSSRRCIWTGISKFSFMHMSDTKWVSVGAVSGVSKIGSGVCIESRWMRRN